MPPRILVDISTAWRMSGRPPVGVSRVEREIARRLLDDTMLRSLPVVFWANTVYAVDRENAIRALADDGRSSLSPLLNPDSPDCDGGARPTTTSARASVAHATQSVPRPGLKRRVRRIVRKIASVGARRVIRLTPARAKAEVEQSFLHARNVLVALLRSSPPQPRQERVPRPVDVINRSLLVVVHPLRDDIVWTCGLYSHCVPLRQLAEMKTRTGFRLASICYDLIRVRRAEWNPEGYSTDVFVANTVDLLDASDMIFCISGYVQDDLRRFAAESGRRMPPSKLLVLGADLPRHLGSSGDAPGHQVTRFASKRFALTVGTIEPRKNYSLLLRVWDELSREPGFDLDLAIVGNEGFGAAGSTAEIWASPLLGDRVHWLRDVADNDLAFLYDRCHVFLCPSLDEGWGLPVVEALAHGRPVISSDRGGLPEASRGQATLLNPLDKAAWMGAVRRAAARPREEVRALATPTWDAAAAVVREGLLTLARDEWRGFR